MRILEFTAAHKILVQFVIRADGVCVHTPRWMGVCITGGRDRLAQEVGMPHGSVIPRVIN